MILVKKLTVYDTLPIGIYDIINMIFYCVNFCSIPFYYGISCFLQQLYHIILFVICQQVHVDVHVNIMCSHSNLIHQSFCVAAGGARPGQSFEEVNAH